MPPPKQKNGSNGTERNGYSFFELLMAVVISGALLYIILTGPYAGVIAPGFKGKFEAYNDTPLSRPQKNDDDSMTHSLFMITDLDHESKVAGNKNLWQSLTLRASLTIGKDLSWARLNLGETRTVSSQISAGGRAMELSDLVVFNGRLYSCDDRTGLLYEIDVTTSKAYPWVFLPDGPGDKSAKGLKAEWMTVKDNEMYVGGLGKEWTTTTGEYVNDHPMWIKVIGPDDSLRHENWKDVFIKARRAIGIEYPGYTINEAVQWSEGHKRWFFLPRRASTETYTEEADEFRGTNKLISCNEKFDNWKVATIGDKGDGARGFSAFQFIPGTNNNLIVALKSEEKDGKPVASYLTVFSVGGTVILKDTPLEGAHKYEGIAFA